MLMFAQQVIFLFSYIHMSIYLYVHYKLGFYMAAYCLSASVYISYHFLNGDKILLVLLKGQRKEN